MASKGGTVSCVQVDQGDFDQILTNYRLMSARYDKLELRLKALNKVSQFAAQTESSLKVEKKRSRQFESAYIASEAKLGHLIKMLLLNKEDRPADVDILESLLGMKTDELYTAYTERDTQGVDYTHDGPIKAGQRTDRTADTQKTGQKTDRTADTQKTGQKTGSQKTEKLTGSQKTEKLTGSQKTEKSTGSEQRKDEKNVGETTSDKVRGREEMPLSRDLETDDVPLSPSGWGQVETNMKASDQHVTKPTDLKSDAKNSPIECKFQEDDMSLMGHVTPELIAHVTRDKKRLQHIIHEFQEQQPEAWKAYIEYKQYEDLVQNLRLEVASLRITNTELQQLLAAKRGNRTDELSNKALELEKMVDKLRKEVKSKHTLLQCINKEYKRVKEENHRLGEGGRGEMVQEYGSLRAELERLRGEKSDLEGECEKYVKILEMVSPPGVDVTDQSYVTNSWSELWDENDKLKRNIESYRHELEQKQKTLNLNQAQIFQEELQTAQTEKRNMAGTLETVKAQFQISQEELQAAKTEKRNMAGTLETMKAQKESTQRLRWELDTVQSQFSKVQASYDELLTACTTLQTENKQLKRFVPTTPGLGYPLQPHRGLGGGLGRGLGRGMPEAVFAGGFYQPQRPTIEADGASLPPEVDACHKGEPSQGLHKQHSSPAQIGLVAKETTPRSRANNQQQMSGDFLECPQCFREFKPTEKQKFEEHMKKCVP